MEPALLEMIVLALLTGLALAGPSFEMRAKRDEGAADLRRMGKLTEDLKYLSGLRQTIPAGKRSDIEMLQTEFVTAKPTESTLSSSTTRRPESSSIVNPSFTNVAPNVLGQDFIKSRSLESQDTSATGPLITEPNKTPASAGTTIVVPIVSEQDLPKSEGAPVSSKPNTESPTLGIQVVQVQELIKSRSLDASTPVISTLAPTYVAGSSGTNGAGNDPSIGVNRPTEPSVFRSKSLDTAPGSTVVDSHTPNSIVSTAGILGQDKAPAKSQESNVLSTKYDNGTVSKNVSISLGDTYKAPHVVLKNSTTLSVLNTTNACPQNSTNCTQKAKKLVPLGLGDTFKLNNSTTNKTLEGANGGVIDFLKRYFTW